jgi:replication factor A1
LLKEISKDKAKAPMFFTSTCIIHSFGDSFYYTGCPHCRRKISLKESNGKCPHCSKSYEEIGYFYLCSLLVADGSEQCWVQAFGEAGEALLGISAKELVEWTKEDKEWTDHPAVIAALDKKFTMRIKKKADTKGGHGFVIERILTKGLSEQNTGFLQRLELFYSYLLN